VDELVAVDEDAIADAMVLLMERAKLYVEGAGAVGVAAVTAGLVVPASTGTTCVVLSGGNVDLGIVPGLIRRHETKAGRRLVVFARIGDRPGSMVRLLAEFAAAGANLVEVEHLREGVDLHVRETGVHATFEVRSREHGREVLAAVRDAGYPVVEARPGG
jgi:threonine dehydratase